MDIRNELDTLWAQANLASKTAFRAMEALDRLIGQIDELQERYEDEQVEMAQDNHNAVLEQHFGNNGDKCLGCDYPLCDADTSQEPSDELPVNEAHD